MKQMIKKLFGYFLFLTIPLWLLPVAVGVGLWLWWKAINFLISDYKKEKK